MIEIDRVIGLLGGTFDPVHNGHVFSALALKQQLRLDELSLLPCHQRKKFTRYGQ